MRGEAALAYLATAQWPAGLGAPEPPVAPVHPYQLARGGLALPWPTATGHRPGAGAADVMVVARLLRDSYGLARLQWRAPNPDPVPPPALRPAPSGGAKYPCDLYLETGGTGGGPEGLGGGKIHDGIPAGVWCYDPVHHRLVPLPDRACPPGRLRVYVVVALDRNVKRYGDFGYRLHCLDAGALVGQLVEEAAGLGRPAAVRYHFPDHTLAARLGLDLDRECVYAVVDVGPEESTVDPDPDWTAPPPRPAGPAGPAGPAVGWRTDLPARLHAASLAGRPDRCRRPVPAPDRDLPSPTATVWLPAPAVSAAGGSLALRRRSCEGHFSGEAIGAQALADLLAAAAAGPADDLDARHLAILCVVNHVTGLDRGAYLYDATRHGLGLVNRADLRRPLQDSLDGPLADAAHAAVCVVTLADFAGVVPVRGDRWVRILNMAAGFAVQKMYRVAAAHGLAGQALCAFAPDRMGDVLGVARTGPTPQIALLVGGRRAIGRRYELSLWDA